MYKRYEASLEGLSDLADEVLRDAGKARLFGFEGALGAGKTTLIAHLAKALGSTDDVQSPTYAIVNEYLGTRGEPIYHLDLYRIESLEEALDAGVHEYMDSGRYCLVEWPDRVHPIWPPEAVRVSIEQEGEKRIFKVWYPK